MRNAHELLLEHFAAPSDADSVDLIWEYGDPIQALLLFPVFFPEFEEVDGHVVLKYYLEGEGGPERLRELLRSGERPLADVLDGYRWREVPSQFRDIGPADERALVALAEMMAWSWRAALKTRFPDRDWSTAVLSPQETGGELGVAFKQVV